MKSTPAGSSNSGGEGGGDSGETSRRGLNRFRSAQAIWLESLLEGDEEDPLKESQCLTDLLTANSGDLPPTRSSVPFDHGLLPPSGIFRQNSSPADLFTGSGVSSDEYLSNFGMPASYDYFSPSIDVLAGKKRARELETRYSGEFSSQVKGEQSGQVSLGISGLTDMNMEKMSEDPVPCRVRAKRGCATHPRSIAERVRRTRISDRIRKLQELVPNMDKQTNTADMLDEAVEYVKSLQRQIQDDKKLRGTESECWTKHLCGELTEQQRICKCPHKAT